MAEAGAPGSATPSEFAGSELPVSEADGGPEPGPTAFPPYPPYAVEPAPPSVADTIMAGRDIRRQHKSLPRKSVRPVPKPARPRGPKATDVKMSKRALRAHARCLRRHGAVLTDRLERISKPRRRDVIYLWRDNAHRLPPETIGRLRSMLDADEPFKPDQAYEYFINLKKSKKKNVAMRVNQIKRDVASICGDRRFVWARNATVAFARGIQQRLARPGRYALADGMLRLSNIILDEICGHMHMRTPSRRCTHPKAKFMMEMADKVAIWIDEILSESDDRMLMMDFDEDEDALRVDEAGGDAGFADDFLNMMADGGLLSGETPAHLKFTGEMLEAFTILTDAMYKKGDQQLISHGKFTETYSEAADELKRTTTYQALDYNITLSNQLNSDLSDLVKPITPKKIAPHMKNMLEICSNYLAQYAEYNKDKGPAFKHLVKMLRGKPNELLYQKEKARRTYGTAATELENARGLDSNHDDPNLSQAVHAKLTKLVEGPTPDDVKPDDLKETLDTCSKYISQCAVDEIERGPAFDILIYELDHAGAESFHPEVSCLSTNHAAAYTLKSAPGFSSVTPNPAAVPMFANLLHRVVDTATPKDKQKDMSEVIQRCANYLSAFARDREKVLGSLLQMMKSNPTKVFAERNNYTMTYGIGASEIETAPALTPFLPVKDIADEGRAKLTKDMEKKTPPGLEVAMKTAIDDVSKHLSQATAVHSGFGGDRYPLHLLAAVKKTLGKRPLFKYKVYGQTYSDAADVLRHAGPLESDERSEQLKHQIHSEMKRGVPTKLAPTLTQGLHITMDDAAKHLAKVGMEKGDTLEHLVNLMKDKGETPLGQLQGYPQTYTDGARRVEVAPSLFNDKVDKGAYEGVRGKLTDLAQSPPPQHEKHMPGLIDETSKFLASPFPETEAEKRRVLADLMGRKGDEILGQDGPYKMTYAEGGQELMKAPIGVTTSHDAAKMKGIQSQVTGVIPEKKLQNLLKDPTHEGSAYLTDVIQGRGEAMKVIHAGMKNEKDKEFVNVGSFRKTHEQAADMISSAPHFAGHDYPSPVIYDKVAGSVDAVPKHTNDPLAKKHMTDASGIASRYIADVATQNCGLDPKALAAMDDSGLPMSEAARKKAEEEERKRREEEERRLRGSGALSEEERRRLEIERRLREGGLSEEERRRLEEELRRLGGGTLSEEERRRLEIERRLREGGLSEEERRRLEEELRRLGGGTLSEEERRRLEIERRLREGGLSEEERRRLEEELRRLGGGGLGGGALSDEERRRLELEEKVRLYGIGALSEDERRELEEARRRAGGRGGAYGAEFDPEHEAALSILHKQLRARGGEMLYKQPHTELTHTQASDWIAMKPPMKVDKTVKESGDTARLHKKFERKLGALVSKVTPTEMYDAMQDVIVESSRILSEYFVSRNYKALVREALVSEMQRRGNEILVEVDGAAETFFFAAQRLKKAKTLEVKEPCNQVAYYLTKKLEDAIRCRSMARKLTATMKDHIKDAADYLSEIVTKPDQQIEAYVSLLGEMEVAGDALLIEGDIPKSYKEAAAYLRQLTSYDDHIRRSNSSLQSSTESKLKKLMANVTPTGYKKSILDGVIADSTRLLVSYIMLQGEKTEALKVLIEQMERAGPNVLLRHGAIRKTYADGASILHGKNTDQLRVTSADPVVVRKIEIKLNNLMQRCTPEKYQAVMDDVIEDATMYLAVHLLQAQVIQVCKCMKNVFVQCELWCDEILRRVARPCCTCSRHVSAQALEDLVPVQRLRLSPGTSHLFAPGVEISLTQCPSKQLRKQGDKSQPCPATKPTSGCLQGSTTSYLMYSTLYGQRFGYGSPTNLPGPLASEALPSSQSPVSLSRSPNFDATPAKSLISDLYSDNVQILPEQQQANTNEMQGSSDNTSPSYYTPPTSSTSGMSRDGNTYASPYWQSSKLHINQPSPVESRSLSITRNRSPYNTITTDQMSDWHAMMVSLMWNVQAWRDWIQENLDRALEYQHGSTTSPEEAEESWATFQRRVATEALQWRQYNNFSRLLTLRLSLRYRDKQIVSPTRATVKTESYAQCQQEMLEIIEMFNRWTRWLTVVVKETDALQQVAGSNMPIHELRWDHFKKKVEEYAEDWTKYNTHLKVCWEHRYRSIIADWLPAWTQTGPVWVVSACGAVPSGAVAAGVFDGEVVWVARTTHRCNVMPAALHPSKHCCLVYADGAVHRYTKYQVMCNADVTWVAWRAGSLGARAVRVAGGVYAGRVQYRGSHLLGAVHAPNYRCHVVIFGRPFAFNCYELLVLAD